MLPTMLLEVCVDSVASAVAAEQGGAHRVELCNDLAEGGITPSGGLIATVRNRVAIPVHVLIRPRAGNFCYAPDEFEIMKKDIALAKQHQANGVVLGILNPDQTVDIARTRELVELARPLSVTFHRAFDVTPDLPVSLESILATRADRILTSGGAPTADQGAEMIARLVSLAAGRVTIMACGHIRDRNVSRIVGRTDVREVHANLASVVANGTRAFSAAAGNAPSHAKEPLRAEVLVETVAGFLRAASQDQAKL